MISIEDFFFDDPRITPKNPWKPLPNHSLEQSPCYPIIGILNKYRMPFYYCKLHPVVENIYLQSVEHHCKFSKAEFHKSEILRFFAKILAKHESTTELKQKMGAANNINNENIMSHILSENFKTNY